MNVEPPPAIRAATVSVASVDAAVARYRESFDYRVVEDGAVDADLAASWAAPAVAGRRFAVLRPASGARVDLRVVESDPDPAHRPLSTYGWAALEVCVVDVHATHARMAGGAFEVVGPPQAIATLTTIHPMQVRGPDGEIVYLTQMLGDPLAEGLPVARAPIDRLFIVVAACRDLAATAAWFARQLDVVPDAPIDIPYRMINRSFGLPEGTLHRLVTLKRDGAFCVELDQYPPAATMRAVARDGLPAGVALCTFAHADLDRVPGPWLAEPVVRDGAVYEGRRVGMLRAPEGALVELVEERS